MQAEPLDIAVGETVVEGLSAVWDTHTRAHSTTVCKPASYLGRLACAHKRFFPIQIAHVTEYSVAKRMERQPI